METINLSILSDKREFLKVVNQGIEGATVRDLVTKYPEYRDTVVSALGVTNSNLSRLYTKQLNKQQTEEILDLLKVKAEAIEVFEDENMANEWLFTSIPALGGEVPINLLDTFVGRSLVSDALTAIRYGEFA